MPSPKLDTDATREQQIPGTFTAYLRSFGPGLIIVLTWLGAGDIVEVAVAGGNYGYALMWVIVVALVMRYLFVSLIAKYQLCNQHGEGVLDGLGRLHRFYPPFLLVAAVAMGHIYGSYMTVGAAEATAHMLGWGRPWQWAIWWNGVALILVFRPAYLTVERVFKAFLALLSVSFIGSALWVGPSGSGILEGILALEMPDQVGPFDSMFVAVGMIGAVGGSIMNLVYPYFLEQKGWNDPRFRRVQTYDFILAILVMIVLDLAIWTLGAELLHPRGLTVSEIDDLPRLLSEVAGTGGRLLFYLGIFSAVFTSLVGHALGLATLGTHAFLRWKSGERIDTRDYSHHRIYRWIVVWCLVSPLIWTMPGLPGFVGLTLVANSFQVFLVPLIAGGLWVITARARYIGETHKNRWWENLVMGLLFALALWATAGLAGSFLDAIDTIF